jgi:hypothetical protein
MVPNKGYFLMTALGRRVQEYLSTLHSLVIIAGIA